MTRTTQRRIEGRGGGLGANANVALIATGSGAETGTRRSGAARDRNARANATTGSAVDLSGSRPDAGPNTVKRSRSGRPACPDRDVDSHEIRRVLLEVVGSLDAQPAHSFNEATTEYRRRKVIPGALKPRTIAIYNRALDRN